ncbi:MAG: thioredoxin family protein [Nitrospirae bacterium]|nr:thioredoxin family protein [Nitrospirota bacterium]
MGCPTCRTPNDNITQALAELGLHVRVVASTDIGEAQERGVTRLPALVVDGKVRSQGKTLSVEDIKTILREPEKANKTTGGEE